MNPAYSVIFFTVATGAGYGLLLWLAVAYLCDWWLPGTSGDLSGRLALVAGVALVGSGLLSSTLHLGHPERSWRAMSQWRSSWLSREGVLAIVCFVPIVAFVAGWWFGPEMIVMMRAGAIGIVVLALATVFSTAMIYTSLKPVPRWCSRWVPVTYLMFCLASGAILATLFASLGATVPRGVLAGASLLLVLAWLIKIGYWRQIDGAGATSTVGTATGLGHFGQISMLESPHTSANYVLKEMGFSVARKHAMKLRRIALIAGSVVPVVSIVVAAATGGFLQTGLLILASAGALLGLVVERWLFFAEAQHVVTLFYGAQQA